MSTLLCTTCQPTLRLNYALISLLMLNPCYYPFLISKNYIGQGEEDEERKGEGKEHYDDDDKADNDKEGEDEDGEEDDNTDDGGGQEAIMSLASPDGKNKNRI